MWDRDILQAYLAPGVRTHHRCPSSGGSRSLPGDAGFTRPSPQTSRQCLIRALRQGLTTAPTFLETVGRGGGANSQSVLGETEARPTYRRSAGTMTPRAQAARRPPVIVCSPDSETGVVPGVNPRPQCAFKMSMFNVSCNSH